MKLPATLTLLFALCVPPLCAQDPASAKAPAGEAKPAGEPAAEPAELKDIGWPREFKTDNHTVVVFQPQIEEWKDYQLLKMRAAVAVSKTGDEENARYGGLFAEVKTDVDNDSRQVLLTDRKVTKLTFPEADEAETQRLAGIMKLALPDKQDLIVSLDRVVAAVALSEQQMQQVEASSEVPPIFVSEEPALLVMFIGEPAFEPVADTGLLFASNTNWDVFMTTGEKASYYLRMEESWFTTTDPKAKSWQPAATLPDAFGKLPADENWEETRENIPGKPAKDPVKVLYSDRPAELIVIEGKPSMAPVVGTKLMYIKNTEADLFFHTATASYYFLSSGRWFMGKSFVEGWKFAPDELPAEFAEIPEDHEKAHVLASVRGTPAASEAVIMASIPERATIKRDEATLEVSYDGEPKFAGVAGEKGEPGVEYALNSNFDIFKVGDLYYCCFQAVWYVSSTSNGPWVVCDNVPGAIYEIPPEHPKHNVTYVTVYSSTPTTVETGYTSGYTGSYVVNGLVMFGLGYWIAKERYNDYYWPYWRRYHCRPCWYGYGCRATWYNGRYWRGASRYYGPYGGAGRNAIYNPRTGGWARSAYAYGPRGSAYTRAAYNPYTNTYGRKTRVSTPYGTGTRGVVSRNGNWAKGGKYTNARGSVGGIRGSGGGGAIRVDKRFGGQGGIAKTPGGDIYVGRDGNIHKLDPGSGEWRTRQGNTWKTTGKSELARRPSTGGAPARLDTSRLPSNLDNKIGRPSTRPSVGIGGVTRPAVQPSRPATRPSVTPSRPAVQPSRPATRPAVQPSRPATRPSVTPSRPAVQPSRPATRPAVQPSRPTTRPAVQPSVTRQLDRSAYSRSRGTSTTLRRSSGSSRSFGGSRGGSRGGGRR